jgi:DNA (cytosine-5)-methyltransferase 1
MREATNGKYPKYAIWENVTGSLSSNGGQDFKCVLEKITEAEIPIPQSSRWANAGMVRRSGCSFAWRVFDSQYWGVPQSRKRIFLVADFRGQSAGKILFEQRWKTRDITKSQQIKQKIITNNEKSIRTTGEGKQITSTLFASYGTKWNGNNGAYTGSHFVLESDGKLRRLTPLESERLMGFPDRWTDGFKDTIRYRMLGNSVVIPCVQHIFEEIIHNQM